MQKRDETKHAIIFKTNVRPDGLREQHLFQVHGGGLGQKWFNMPYEEEHQRAKGVSCGFDWARVWEKRSN